MYGITRGNEDSSSSHLLQTGDDFAGHCFSCSGFTSPFFFFSFFLFGFDYYGPRLRLMLSVPQQSRLWAELVDSQTRTRGSSQGKSYPSPRVLYQRKYHHRPTLLYLFENNLMTGETEKKKKKKTCQSRSTGKTTGIVFLDLSKGSSVAAWPHEQED